MGAGFEYLGDHLLPHVAGVGVVETSALEPPYGGAFHALEVLGPGVEVACRWGGVEGGHAVEE